MRTYTQEEKQAVIDRVISGEPSAHILADTGIPKSTFYSWLRIYQEEQNAANKRTVDIRNFHLLENKVARLESIVEILKSSPCTPRAPLRQRLYAAEQLYGKYNVHVICDAFDIPRGNYRSKAMNDYMRSLHITHSFSRAHVPYDNSVMESFFGSLKREELYRTKYRSEADFRSAVDKYIIFYNKKRPHKKLQYKTPEQKEEEYALKDAGL